MTTSIDRPQARAALLIGFCAGMVDLVALAVWVGTLIGQDHFSPRDAGALVTLFLSGIVLASVMLAPRLQRIRVRIAATLGFALSAAGFAAGSQGGSFGALAAMHLLCGMATGAALSAVLGTIARSARPHRLFAYANAALGVFAIAFLAVVPHLVASFGSRGLFDVLAAIMTIAALSSAVAFPSPAPAATRTPSAGAPRIPRGIFYGVIGIASMSLVQAMAFSFLQRVGIDHGFRSSSVAGVLIALGMVNLLPAPLAALLESRLPARRVVLCGPIAQAFLVAVMMNSRQFAAYAIAASLLTSVIVFTETFAFGWLARLEPTGRVLAAMPAMMMTGSAVGPFLGGTLVQSHGYHSLAPVAAAVAAMAVLCFSRLPVHGAAVSHQPEFAA